MQKKIHDKTSQFVTGSATMLCQTIMELETKGKIDKADFMGVTLYGRLPRQYLETILS